MLNRIIIILMLTLSLISLSYAGTLAENTLLYYTFDGNINDSTGNATSSNVGSTDTADGILNNGREFVGASSQYVRTNFLGNALTESTINVWVKADGAAGTQMIFGKRPTPSNRFQLFTSGGSYVISLRNSAGSITTVSSVSAPTVNSYSMVTAIWDGVLLRIFVNGTSEQSGTFSGTIDPTLAFLIGADNRTTGAQDFFNRKIDELAFISRNITTVELAFLFNGGAPTSSQQFPYISAIPTVPVPISNITNGTVFPINNLSFSVNTSGATSNISFLLNPTLPFSNNRILYLNFDNNTVDETRNNPDGVMQSGAGYGTGQYGLGLFLEGQSTSEFLSIADDSSQSLATNFTLMLWGNQTLFRSDSGLIVKYQTTGNQRSYYISTRDTNEILVGLSADGTANSASTSANNCGFTSNGVWTHIAVTYAGGDLIYYKNGVLCDTDTNAQTTTFDSTAPLEIGARSFSSDFFNGTIDEVQIFNTTLNASTIEKLFNDTYVNVCLNCNSGTVNLTNLADQIHIIKWLAFNNTGAGITFNNFIVDTLLPNLSVNFPVEFTSYRGFNFSEFITVTDVNLDSCIVIVSRGEPNTTCFEEDYNFTFNGNHTLNVTANDTAGNTVSSLDNIMLVNPFQVFRFNNSFTGSLVTGYTFGNFTPNGTDVFIKTFDVGLGNTTLEFVRTGFLKQNFTFELNSTSELNVTFNVTPVTLTMQMFNVNNLTQSLVFDVTIFNSTTSILFTNQTILQQEFNTLPHGNITMAVTSIGFANANFFNELTSFTSINVTGFLISSANASIITFTVLEFGSSDPLPLVTIEAQQLINGSFVTISQAQTDNTGKTFMNLDVLEEYTFVISKDGFLTAVINAIPGTVSYTIRLRLEVEAFIFADGVSYSLSPLTSLLFVPDNFTFTAIISGTSITLSTYTLTSDNGTVLFTATSTNPTGTTFTTTLELLNSTNITTIIADLTYVRNALTTSITREYTIARLDNTTFIAIAQSFALQKDEDSNLLRWFLMIATIAGGLLAGRLLNLNATGSGLIIIPIVFFFVFVQWMPLNYGVALAGASIFFFVGGRAITA